MRNVLHRVLIIAAIAALTHLLDRRLGPARALLTVAGVAAVLCLLGVVLLRVRQGAPINWCNRLVGHLLPWGYRLGRGRLGFIALLSWAGWVAIALLTLVATRPGAAVDVAHGGGAWVGWLTLATWLVLGLAALTMGYHWMERRRARSPGGDRLATVALTAAGLMAASMALYAAGWPFAALLVGGLPIVIACGPVAVMLLVVLGYAVAGKPLRWQ